MYRHPHIQPQIVARSPWCNIGVWFSLITYALYRQVIEVINKNNDGSKIAAYYSTLMPSNTAYLVFCCVSTGLGMDCHSVQGFDNTQKGYIYVQKLILKRQNYLFIFFYFHVHKTDLDIPTERQPASVY